MPSVLLKPERVIMSAESRIAQDVAERQVQMFAMFVGPGLTVTRAALSKASGIPESTLKSYAGGAAMPLHAALTLSRFLPVEALDMLTEPAGKRLVDRDASSTNWDLIAAATSGLTFEICDARADGQIDHVERAALRGRCRALAAQLTSLAGEA